LDRRRALCALAGLGLYTGLSYSQNTKVFRVGVLRPGSAKEPASVQREPFERGLRELGWIPGSNLLIDYRYGEGDAGRLPRLARDLVSQSMDVIVVTGPPAANAVRAASASVPMVMAASVDPIAEGFALNLARPGRNTTGIVIFTFEMDGKRLELLKETFPRIRRVALLANPSSEPPTYKDRIAELRQGARRRELDVEVFEVTQKEEIAGALKAIERGSFDALMVRPEPRVMDIARAEIAATAARLKLPAIYAFRFYAEAGGLMSYGESIPGFHYSSASYVSRILRGANASDLAFERPTKFELVINLKAAKALGVELPKATLFRADHLIQ
jgi:putative tryptophan/tyrosine transport system substrate-binding protein